METSNLPKISEDLFRLVVKLSMTVFKQEEFFKASPLAPSQVKVLFFLMHNGPTTMSDLAHHLCISKPNMTPIVDKLLQEGLVRRLENPKDRRTVLIEMTPNAVQLFEDHKQFIMHQLELRITPLAEEELETIHHCVNTLIPILNKIDRHV